MSEPTGGGRWSRIYEAMTGASAPPGPHDHDVDVPGAKPESVTAGHEPDKFDAKGIIFVPILVIMTAGMAYVIVTLLFGAFEFGQPDKNAVNNPRAAEEGGKYYNDRIGTISTTSPTAEFHEPRLEGLKPIDASRNGKPADPPYVRSFQQKDDQTRVPFYTPQDLYPDRYTDPLTGKKLLLDYEYANEKKTVARIPIAEAMKLVKLPAAKKATPNSSFGGAPKLSNGGQNNAVDVPKAAANPAPAKAAEHHE